MVLTFELDLNTTFTPLPAYLGQTPEESLSSVYASASLERLVDLSPMRVKICLYTRAAQSVLVVSVYADA